MRPPDVGNQAEIGLGDRTEQGDFAAGARPHLHHAQLRVARHRQQRKGYADMVVEIALRGVDRVFFGQHADFLVQLRILVTSKEASLP